jgi:hypothetical protein
MARPRCDGFDAASVRAAIEHGKATERAAYLAYAATAARPYARSCFGTPQMGLPLSAHKTSQTATPFGL